MLDLQNYYARPAVRQRMVEFLGGHRLEQTSAVYLTADDRSPGPGFHPRPPSQLWACLESGLEVMRSLWDRRSLLFHLDIEYVNFDYPAEPYLDPERSLELQRPLIRLLRQQLLTWGIAPLHLLSGRGHHLVWRIDRGSAAYRRLVELGVLPDTLRAIYESFCSTGETVGLEAGAAFAGAGQILEYAAVCRPDRGRPGRPRRFPRCRSGLAGGRQRRRLRPFPGTLS